MGIPKTDLPRIGGLRAFPGAVRLSAGAGFFLLMQDTSVPNTTRRNRTEFDQWLRSAVEDEPVTVTVTLSMERLFWMQLLAVSPGKTLDAAFEELLKSEQAYNGLNEAVCNAINHLK